MKESFWFGKLSLAAIPLDVPIVRNTDIAIIVIAVLVLLGITFARKWTYLWKEWITTVDHKKIGVIYILFAFIMLLRGYSDAVLMRGQQMVSVGHNFGYLPPEHYAQIFSAHGVIMIFFVAMPLMFGLINLVLPIQIGARDVAYPYLNSLSVWLTIIGGILVMLSLIVGKFSDTGWLAYPPLSGIKYSPGVGVDYYIWALQISGVGSLLSGINFTATILKLRCPGMTFFRMPVFVWTVLCAMILVMLAFPILTGALGMLALDRYLGMHFFTIGAGGNAMMYINLIWAWGHPEVYILILPSFGIFSEVTANFCRKRLFGYHTMVWATIVITFLSFVVWLHHFFTMGAGANVNAFFGITTMIIAIPTGVKIFNWLFTMYKGKIDYASPMLWTIAFLLTFVIGGMTGVLLAVPPADFQLHNSVFLVAHFHNAIIGGVVYGYFAGIYYWFPKIFGFRLNERLGKLTVYLWFIGFLVAFMPLYFVGLKGMTRRLYHYSAMSGYHPYLIACAVGAGIIGLAVVVQIIQLIWSIYNRNKEGYKITDGDAWGHGRTLEWSIPTPAPFYNFARIPVVHDIDAFADYKEHMARSEQKEEKPQYNEIHMPKNTAVGFIIAVFTFFFGFGLTWHIPWMWVLGIIGIIGALIARSLDQNVDYYVKVSEIERIETAGGAA